MSATKEDVLAMIEILDAINRLKAENDRLRDVVEMVADRLAGEREFLDEDAVELLRDALDAKP